MRTYTHLTQLTLLECRLQPTPPLTGQDGPAAQGQGLGKGRSVTRKAEGTYSSPSPPLGRPRPYKAAGHELRQLYVLWFMGRSELNNPLPRPLSRAVLLRLWTGCSSSDERDSRAQHLLSGKAPLHIFCGACYGYNFFDRQVCGPSTGLSRLTLGPVAQLLFAEFPPALS